MDRKQYAKYLGKSYPIYVQEDPNHQNKKPTLEFDGRQFNLTVSLEKDPSNVNTPSIDLEKLVIRFYHRQAKSYIGNRLKHYQKHIKTRYRSFSIESHPDKWGSCNSQRHLTFHWYLMSYPETAVDYVVVHELCHLEHLNHDRSFWRLVGRIIPDYKEAQALLGEQ